MAVSVASCTTGRPVMPAAAPTPEVNVETFEVSVTSMPPRRALMELEAELARTYCPAFTSSRRWRTPTLPARWPTERK